MWILLVVVVVLLGSAALPSFWGGAWSPTPMNIVNEMLALAHLQIGETLYDLGAGDGRVILNAASQYGVKAIGVEIDPVKVFLINVRIQLKGLGRLVHVLKSDFFKADLSKADVVFLYLSPVSHNRLSEKLLTELSDRARVVSYRRTMGDWPSETVDGSPNLHLYHMAQVKEHFLNVGQPHV